MENKRKYYRLQPNIVSKSFSILNWLGKLNNLSSSNQRIINELLDKIITVTDTRGYAEGIKYSKNLRSTFQNFILSDEKCRREILDARSTVAPKPLRRVFKYIILNPHDYSFIRITMTALVWSRYLHLKPKPSFETIEAGSSHEVPHYLCDERNIKLFLKEIGVNTKFIGKPPKQLRFKKFHMTSKSGPNGHALWASFRDALSLSHVQLENIKVLAGDGLINLISKLTDLYEKIPYFFEARCTRKGDMCTRKLMAIPDKEGKTREVAILDYYSQAALKPLHDYTYKILNHVSQDCTHDQLKLVGKLKNDIGSSYHSIDLTAATDRFPITIQQNIYKVWFGEEYANNWKTLMVGTPFRHDGREISYRVGNPMGAYSSFTSFAIAHHYLVFVACQMANRNWSRCPYMLLGDDIVIANDNVADCYKMLLRDCGIPFNPLKTHVSESGYEFAKNIVINRDVNVSPFPISALLRRHKSPFLAASVIYSEVWNKNWEFDMDKALKDFYLEVLKWKYDKYHYFSFDLGFLLSILDYFNGRGSIGNAIKQYVCAKSTKPNVKKLSDVAWDKLSHNTIPAVLRSSFEKSRDRIVDSKNHKPLGGLATDMVMAITSTRDGGADCFDLIESIPFLQIYGLAEEKYIKAKKFIPVSGDISPSQYKLIYEKVNIPLSDDGFYVRNRDVLVVTSLETARNIKSYLHEYPKVFDPDERTIYDPQLGWWY